MALRRPSQRSIDLYNALVDKQNQVRKQLRKIHKHAEESIGAGRLPALVIPKTAHKIKKSYFVGLSPEKLRARLQAYWKTVRERKAIFASGLDSYLKHYVMKGYQELYTDNAYGIGYKPNGYFGRYSKEQMEADEDNAPKMRAYNALFTRGADFFMALLYTGHVVEFKWIYLEFKNGTSKEINFLDEQTEEANRLSSPKNRAKLYEKAEEITGYKHPNNLKRRADNKRDNELARSLGAEYAGGQGLKGR